MTVFRHRAWDGRRLNGQTKAQPSETEVTRADRAPHIGSFLLAILGAQDFTFRTGLFPKFCLRPASEPQWSMYVVQGTLGVTEDTGEPRCPQGSTVRVRRRTYHPDLSESEISV